MRRLLAILAFALALPACETPEPRLAGSGMDMFAPVAIRFYPLSRIVMPTAPTTATAPATNTAPTPTTATKPATQDSGLKTQPTFEARLELTDQFNDPTKSPGTIQLELFDQPPLTHKGPLLQSWSLSIDTPQDNRDHWDHTLRTYVFKLPLTTPLPKRDHILATVHLTLPNGTILSDELELPLK
jgi:hypothetical protein